MLFLNFGSKVFRTQKSSNILIHLISNYAMYYNIKDWAIRLCENDDDKVIINESLRVIY